MRRAPAPSLLALAGVAVLGACADAPLAPSAAPAPSLSATLAAGATAGNRLVRFQDGIPADFAARVAALGGTVEFTHAATGIALVSGLDAGGAATLGAFDGVAASVADEWVSVPDAAGDQAAGFDEGLSPAAPATAQLFARQWHLRAIGADQAWNAGVLGSPAVTVAILDTGIDPSHRDLVGRVDASRSISFSPSDDALTAFYFPSAPLWTDINRHGTHVAATVSSNALGAAGVTSQVTLMAVKTLGINGGPISATIQGILYATDNGADVINMSLGGTSAKAGTDGLIGLIQSTMNYARGKGVTVVVAAGNDAENLDNNGNRFRRYCDAAAVICVSATGPTASASVNGPWQDVDAPAVYTNYGRSAVSVAAPGGNSGGAVWAACSRTSLLTTACQSGNFTLGLNGTSMASPHVAGLAALLVERHGRNPGRIKTIIEQSADDLGARGTDPYYGKGRINIPRALGL